MVLRSRTLSTLLVAFTVAGSLAASRPVHGAQEHDDCDAGFIAFLGADAYQFSPHHAGELGSVRLFGVLSYQGAAVAREPGDALWRLEVRGPDAANRLVYTANGSARLASPTAAAEIEQRWDGRDQRGEPVPAGVYRYTFKARFLPDWTGRRAFAYDELGGDHVAVEAYASVEEVIVDYGLSPDLARSLRSSAKASTCPTQQNAPLEPGLAYDYYYGSTHSHSNWSDGGQSPASCTSGASYGSGTFDPTDVYDYARNVAGLDFWVVNEHNHLIQDAIANNDPPVTEAKVRGRYAAGLAAADAATQDGFFVALYGMEWGVSTNSDQGHVTLIETPVLFGWETCSNCNGPNPECTPGTNCYFDVFTPKRYGYLTLYERSVENPSAQGALGIFCHPGSGNFDNYAHDANADEAMQGIAVRSGLAFNTAANCADANVASTDYSSRWKSALAKGFHLGPVADHDTHCNNYGQGLPNRTVYLLPNGGGTALTKDALMAAHKARHFFASEDPNAQLVFTTSDGHMMGDDYGAGSSVTLRAALHDPDGEGVSRLEVWRGQIGGAVPSAAYRTVTGSSTLTFTESPGADSYYYYARAVQADGHDLWSAPIWIAFGAGGCADSTAPQVAIAAPASGATISCSDTEVEVSASDAGGIATVEVQVDGGAWNTASFDGASGTYRWTWPSATAGSGAHSIVARATDASCGANVGTTPARSVTVDNASCGVDVGGWRLVQTNSSDTFYLPAGSRIPDGGYLVLGRDATQAQFEGFWRGGAALPTNVVYLDAGGAFPAINGSEYYTLYDAAGHRIDGRTAAMSSSANQSRRRKDPCLSASKSSSWTVSTPAGANPGTGAGAGCGTGVVINEFSDATGSGNYVYEFIELHYDQ